MWDPKERHKVGQRLCKEGCLRIKGCKRGSPLEEAGEECLSLLEGALYEGGTLGKLCPQKACWSG